MPVKLLELQVRLLEPELVDQLESAFQTQQTVELAALTEPEFVLVGRTRCARKKENNRIEIQFKSIQTFMRKKILPLELEKFVEVEADLQQVLKIGESFVQPVVEEIAADLVDWEIEPVGLKVRDCIRSGACEVVRLWRVELNFGFYL